MIIAIDIGGTKTLITSFADDGTMGEVHHLLTNHNTDVFLRDIKQIVDTLHPAATDVISVASAGLIDHQTGAIVHSPNLGWQQFGLRQILADAYHCSVYLDNDANIGALGAVSSLPSVPPAVLYITIGTGIGGGIILDGALHPALANIEIGHMMFETNAGLRSWEDLISGHAIKAEFGLEVSDITDPATWETIAGRLAIGLRALIPALQPNLILVGGGVGAQFSHIEAALNQKLQAQLPSYISVPPIQQAADPEHAVLRGCYRYAHQLAPKPS